jgi:hypothetical protein
MRPIYDSARARATQVGALINGPCDIIEADANGVTFGFKFPLHAEKMSEKRNLDLLGQAVSEVMGKTVSVRCVHDADVEPWKTRESASRSPLVRAAQEMGARILSPEPEDEP